MLRLGHRKHLARRLQGVYLSEVPDFDEPQPAHQLYSLIVQATGHVHQYSYHRTLGGYEEVVCNETLNLAGKVPNAEQISTRQL